MPLFREHGKIQNKAPSQIPSFLQNKSIYQALPWTLHCNYHIMINILCYKKTNRMIADKWITLKSSIIEFSYENIQINEFFQDTVDL